ncbi:MarR family transcriptional regulator [Amycolatopsis ultiminotia]|uniref:MarR family transcriptional regulator n=1 Tax=Amycolatopsis ultiminotia TaxID=543629 RepID=A0ABP6XPZ6_9PSEU
MSSDRCLAEDVVAAPSAGPPSLTDRVMSAGRTLSAASVLLHQAMAGRSGLSPAEHRAVRLIDELGPLTAGELAVRSQLSTGTVTALVDRLEYKGFARRRRHPTDRRRVLIEGRADRIRPLRPLLGGWAEELARLCEGYAEPELETVLHFLTCAARAQEDLAAELTSR